MTMAGTDRAAEGAQRASPSSGAVSVCSGQRRLALGWQRLALKLAIWPKGGAGFWGPGHASAVAGFAGGRVTMAGTDRAAEGAQRASPSSGAVSVCSDSGALRSAGNGWRSLAIWPKGGAGFWGPGLASAVAGFAGGRVTMAGTDRAAEGAQRASPSSGAVSVCSDSGALRSAGNGWRSGDLAEGRRRLLGSGACLGGRWLCRWPGDDGGTDERRRRPKGKPVFGRSLGLFWIALGWQRLALKLAIWPKGGAGFWGPGHASAVAGFAGGRVTMAGTDRAAEGAQRASPSSGAVSVCSGQRRLALGWQRLALKLAIWPKGGAGFWGPGLASAVAGFAGGRVTMAGTDRAAEGAQRASPSSGAVSVCSGQRRLALGWQRLALKLAIWPKGGAGFWGPGLASAVAGFAGGRVTMAGTDRAPKAPKGQARLRAQSRSVLDSGALRSAGNGWRSSWRSGRRAAPASGVRGLLRPASGSAGDGLAMACPSPLLCKNP